jgi:HSP20 family protein
MLYLRNRANGNPYDMGLDRLFDEMTRGFGREAEAGWQPTLDVTETESQWLVRVELPGVAAEAVEVSVVGNVLTVKGEKKAEEAVEGHNVRRTERRHGKFVRSLEFPTDVDAGKVEARSKNGVLTIVLPKAEASRPRTVEVKAE